MTPAMIAIIVSLVEQVVSQTPALVAEFQTIFNNPSPTPADWEALRAKVSSQSYAQLVPDSKLPTPSAAPVG